MNIIKDLRVLNSITKKYGLIFDKQFKYIIKENLTLKQSRELFNKGYDIKYLSGCFYPYLIKINNEV